MQNNFSRISPPTGFCPPYQVCDKSSFRSLWSCGRTHDRGANVPSSNPGKIIFIFYFFGGNDREAAKLRWAEGGGAQRPVLRVCWPKKDGCAQHTGAKPGKYPLVNSSLKLFHNLNRKWIRRIRKTFHLFRIYYPIFSEKPYLLVSIKRAIISPHSSDL